ncbi:MAG: DNA polymerase III subunit delta [Sandaracinaceae bacterium]
MARGADIQDLISRARDGGYGAVHLLVGTEGFLIDRAIRLLRSASLEEGTAGFNDDVFHGASSLKGQSVVSAARTLPMMAQARFVLVRDVEKMSTAEQEPLAGYVAKPSESTCLVMTAQKVHASSKLAKAAKKSKAWVDAKALKGASLRRFATQEAKRRGQPIGPRAAEALLDAVGDDLSAIDDALERLSLYVGSGNRIEVGDVEACVSRIAADSIWALVDSVSMRNTAGALSAAGSLLADREPALRILAMVARQLRIVARMREALASGLRGSDATAQAGAPPFKAKELTESARRFTQRDLAAAFTTLADADLALKGSKRPSERVLEEAILQLCTGRYQIREPIQRRLRSYR